MKTLLIRLLCRLPEQLLPGPLKDCLDRQLEVMLAEAKADVLQRNWQLVQAYEGLKVIVSDPRFPEEKKAEMRKKLEAFGQELDAVQARMAELDRVKVE